MNKFQDIKTKVGNWALFYEKEIIFGIIIFLVASLSFGLGYLANREFNHAPIIIEKNSQ
ncbi:MAG TPA: hypothetical protein VMV71_02270 [Candidatus Paceibacterota bacterium]|nr:hypothetical protein [Candidatus Paceibacterota bacterium]